MGLRIGASRRCRRVPGRHEGLFGPPERSGTAHGPSREDAAASGRAACRGGGPAARRRNFHGRLQAGPGMAGRRGRLQRRWPGIADVSPLASWGREIP